MDATEATFAKDFTDFLTGLEVSIVSMVHPHHDPEIGLLPLTSPIGSRGVDVRVNIRCSEPVVRFAETSIKFPQRLLSVDADSHPSADLRELGCCLVDVELDE